ncbi:MAG: T9SS type A sorting domain-containing protein [Bacteroidales bacterium]
MKEQIITTIWLLTSLALYSQTNTIEFTYDNAGNRTERHVIEMKSPENKTGEQQNEELEKVFAEQMGEQEVRIYPNPTKGLLMVEIKGRKDATNLPAGKSWQAGARMELYGSEGKMVYSIDKVKEKTKVDLSDMKAGTYVLKIVLDERVSSWKVVKE